MQVPALMQKHLYTKHLPRIAILKAVCRFVVFLLSTFCSFSIFVAGVFFALATFLIIVSSSLTLHLLSLLSSSLNNQDTTSALIGQKAIVVCTRNLWKTEFYVIMVTDSTLYRFSSVVNVSRCWETIRKKKKINHLQLTFHLSGVLTTTHVGYLASKLIEKAMNKGG